MTNTENDARPEVVKDPEPLSNTRIWDALGKTDPRHTKAFKRSGGFTGTATKPIWTALRMTNYFGPCGKGWGMRQPEFQVVPTADEIMVYCTVGLWYREHDFDEKALVYGVGGDKVVIKQNSGLRSNDEAFKAAYTDALSNAMKQIGICADIHMGLFDDNKYVRDTLKEFEAEDAPPITEQAPPPAAPANPSREKARDDLKRIITALRGAQTESSIDHIMLAQTDAGVVDAIRAQDEAFYTKLLNVEREERQRIIIAAGGN